MKSRRCRFFYTCIFSGEICRDADGLEPDTRLKLNVSTLSGFSSQAAGSQRADQNPVIDWLEKKVCETRVQSEN